MARPVRQIPPRFRIGQIVEINSSIFNHFQGRNGVVTHVHVSQHSHTLDKYELALPGHPERKRFWDIQLRTPDQSAA
jgi:hypothetical protein